MEYKLWIEKNEGKDYPYKDSKGKKNFLYDSSSGNYHLMPKKLWGARLTVSKANIRGYIYQIEWIKR